MFKKLVFKKIEYVLGDIKEDNNFLIKKNKLWNFKKIYEKTGIKKRYTAKYNQDSLTLALDATKKLLKKVKKNEIDVLLFVTQTPPVRLPQCSSFIQEKLGMKNNLYTLDINLGCSGFVYALTVAKSLAETYNFKNFIIICSDTYNKFIPYNNRTCRTIFSDGASATFLTFENTKKKQLFEIDYGTDGSGYNDLIIKKKQNREQLFMDGAKIFLFTKKIIPKSISKILYKKKISIKKIDYFIFHQASKFVLDNLKEDLVIEDKKVYYGIKNIGNTTSSTIPIALSKIMKKNYFKKNKKIILSGFGVGLSWATLLFSW
jgi:3-oxoacyl-[acyl-carrier-protein] synthase-3